MEPQMDALLQLSSDFDVHILAPMVTLPSDMAAVEEALKDATSRTRPSRIPKLGAMIETPAAALAAADIFKARIIPEFRNERSHTVLVCRRP